MAIYSPKTRQHVLKQLVPPSNLSVMQISRDTGILDCQPFFVHKDAHFLSSSFIALIH